MGDARVNVHDWEKQIEMNAKLDEHLEKFT